MGRILKGGGVMVPFIVSKNTGAAFDRWSATKPIDEGMAAMKVAVAEALDAGVFYTKDLVAKVVSEFDFTEEELSREINKVENGVVGMEIFYARQAVERDRSEAAEEAAGERLALEPGKTLPSIKLFLSGRGYRLLRKPTVLEIRNGQFVLEAAMGCRKYQITTTAVNIENGIQAALKRSAA